MSPMCTASSPRRSAGAGHRPPAIFWVTPPRDLLVLGVAPTICWCWASPRRYAGAGCRPPARFAGAGRHPQRSAGAGHRPRHSSGCRPPRDLLVLGVAPGGLLMLGVASWICLALPRRSAGVVRCPGDLLGIAPRRSAGRRPRPLSM
ncbi:hypothetical protein VNO80_16732 [Phaseolus coccineus]|uniref:Uncharacterized protein n=1 Tax=Phaseolus coccineus TaxID=3886 RepID=A0AAN9MP59_PHACN